MRTLVKKQPGPEGRAPAHTAGQRCGSALHAQPARRVICVLVPHMLYLVRVCEETERLLWRRVSFFSQTPMETDATTEIY